MIDSPFDKVLHQTFHSKVVWKMIAVAPAAQLWVFRQRRTIDAGIGSFKSSLQQLRE